MSSSLVLASGSRIRAELLRNAGVPFTVDVARVDEDSFRRAGEAEGLTPRDIADHLAEMKGQRVASRSPDALVLSCDQVLDFEGRLMSKPDTQGDACADLAAMAGKPHDLYSAVVLFQQGRPIWRHIARVRMAMRPLSDAYIADYVDRNWSEIRHCVGAYQLEREGARLFSAVEGDFFAVLGLPLLPVLDHLATMGVIDT
jgi:septum formation protein